MSRNFILATGAVLWTTFAGYAIVDTVTGNWIAPVITMAVGVAWVAVRQAQRRLRGAT